MMMMVTKFNHTTVQYQLLSWFALMDSAISLPEEMYMFKFGYPVID